MLPYGKDSLSSSVTQTEGKVVEFNYSSSNLRKLPASIKRSSCSAILMMTLAEEVLTELIRPRDSDLHLTHSLQ